MIGVTIREPKRTFYLYVGDKRVGKIISENGQYSCAYSIDCQTNDDFEFVNWCKGLKLAARCILEKLGYGRPDSVAIERLTGVK